MLNEGTEKLIADSVEENKKLKARGEIYEVDPDYTAVPAVKGFSRLDLACGGLKKDGFIGVDVVFNSDWKYKAEDFRLLDLNMEAWPIEDDSVSEIHCSHFIEHVTDIKAFMEECYRILIPNGHLNIVAPYYTSVGAWQDFTHVRAISENTFLYFHQPWMLTNGLTHYGVKCDYNVNALKYYYLPEWQPKSTEAQEFARKHYFNVVAEIILDMVAIKPIREAVNA